ncbi:MAG: hypothetical protein ACP5P4_11260 [Steroidobacteraceae bacterium]
MPHFDIPQSVVNWLSTGERGLSSEFIVDYLYGFTVLEGHWRGTPHHPFDPSDLRRCLLLLADSPKTAAQFPRMRAASPEWARLVDAWADLEEQFLAEIGELRGLAHWSAPLTYAAMKRVLEVPQDGSGAQVRMG